MGNSGKNKKLEKKLNASRQKGQREVNLELSEAQAAFVKDELRFPISVLLYEIQTQRIENVTTTKGLLQEIHRSHKRGDNTIRKSVRPRDLDVLESAGVKFRPVRYRIILSAT